MEMLTAIKPKIHHNYVAFFLTLSCNLHCSYCINLSPGNSCAQQAKRLHLTAEQWIRAAHRLILGDNLPLTLQGGEPTIYKDFYKIVNEVKPEIKMDLLTNMMFNIDEFIANVPVWRFTREAPYAAIRVSFHPGGNDINDLIEKTHRLQDAGFKIGLYGILHPDKEIKKDILKAQRLCLKQGIDFRTKQFLGAYQGRLYGTFKYQDAVGNDKMKYCQCKTTELIVDPAGYVYRCHADLYAARAPIAHILDQEFSEDELDKFRECRYYGDCNSCDIKVTTNRLQIFGHTSVQIKDIDG